MIASNVLLGAYARRCCTILTWLARQGAMLVGAHHPTVMHRGLQVSFSSVLAGCRSAEGRIRELSMQRPCCPCCPCRPLSSWLSSSSSLSSLTGRPENLPAAPPPWMILACISLGGASGRRPVRCSALHCAALAAQTRKLCTARPYIPQARCSSSEGDTQTDPKQRTDDTD